MKYLYGFMQDKKWYEDVGHILIGLIPFVGWGREHSQWPPGWPYYTKPNGDRLKLFAGDEVLELVTQLDRVEDSYRDFLGYEIGSLIRTIILVVLCIMFS